MKLETLPASIEAEKLVLGAAMVDDLSMSDLRASLELDDFSLHGHRRIWDAACRLFDSGLAVDRFTVCEELTRAGLIESVGISYIAELDAGPRLVNLPSYAATLKEKTALRRILLTCDELTKRCYAGDNSVEIIQSASRIVTLGSERGGFVTPADIFNTAGLQSILSPPRTAGIRLPFPWADAALCGLKHEQLIILAARTSIGKTSASLQIATRAAIDRRRVAIFSLEMSKESLIRRMTTQISRVDSQSARSNAMTSSDRDRERAAAHSLMELENLWIDDSAARTTTQIHAALRKHTSKYGKLDLVIVDHLHIVRGTGRFENRNKEVGEIARTLKLLAKEFGCCFLVPAQLSRKQDIDRREPTLSDLRESGEIEENADVVLFLHVPVCPDDVKPGKLIIAKQREGPRDIAREMLFHSNVQCFEEV